MAIFEESHAMAKVIEVGSDFGPVYVTWGGTKRQLSKSGVA